MSDGTALRRSFLRSFIERRFCSALIVLLGVLAMSARAESPLPLDNYRGKVVVVDFWASWCAPCRQSFPWLNSLQARYADRGLVVLGINVDRNRAEAERFLREVPAHFQMFYDPSGVLASQYNLMGMPTSLVFGPDGQLVRTHVGFKKATSAEREAELVELLHRHGLMAQVQK
jgi:cytochrome c biogenesis protein CcmG, thiol:disulfide interchange protein DsbE